MIKNEIIENIKTKTPAPLRRLAERGGVVEITSCASRWGLAKFPEHCWHGYPSGSSQTRIA